MATRILKLDFVGTVTIEYEYASPSQQSEDSNEDKMTTPTHDIPVQILRETSTGSMEFDEYERELMHRRAVHFGLEPVDIARALRWQGKIDYDVDSLGHITRVRLVK